MKKACFYIDFYLNNKAFDISDSLINRDNSAYPYYLLKNEFKKNYLDFSTKDINSISDSEIVIYLDMPKELPDNKDINKSYLIISESEVIIPNNWDYNKHKYFNKIFTWNDNIIDNKKYFKLNFSHLIPKSINKNLSKKEKLCALISGNKYVKHDYELYSKRIEAIRWFEKHKPQDFDLYGVSWEKGEVLGNDVLSKILKKIKLLNKKFPSFKGKVSSKKEIFEKYKFAICYENARDIPGYITEKIFDCFFAGCIPIYWGANNITEHIPENCFIDKRKFNDYQSLYEFMINMSDEQYLEYLENIEQFLNSEKIFPFSAEYFAETIIKEVL